jgi:protein TonB
VAVAESFYHSAYLPWTVSEEEQRRFRRTLLGVFLFCLLFAVVIPFLPVPQIDRETFERVPPRLAKLVLERKQEMRQPAPTKPVEPEVKTVKKAPKLEKKKIEKRTKPEPPKQDVATARKRAGRAGLLAFKDELAALRDEPVLQGLKNDKQLQRGAGQEAAKTERSVVVANATRASGGINTSNLSRDTGGVGLAGRANTKVESSVQGTEQARVHRGGGTRKASRSIEEIQLVFDRNKAAIYSIYNRALRKDPTLQGKVVLKITIEPSGKVAACEIVSSELGDPMLERKLIARILLFDFGIKDVEKLVVTYPIDFLPS